MRETRSGDWAALSSLPPALAQPRIYPFSLEVWTSATRLLAPLIVRRDFLGGTEPTNLSGLKRVTGEMWIGTDIPSIVEGPPAWIEYWARPDDLAAPVWLVTGIEGHQEVEAYKLEPELAGPQAFETVEGFRRAAWNEGYALVPETLFAEVARSGAD